MRTLATALAFLLLATLAPSQSRISIGGMPSNLLLNLSSTCVVLDPSASDAFFALMPVNAPPLGFSFAVFDSVPLMNATYGAGNWLRCCMTATHWAYLSNDACAHLPAPGLTAPLSMLTSSYDYGAWYGSPGTPHMPWTGATMFGGTWQSRVCGHDTDPFGLQERWQLCTSSYFLQPWNACPAPFSGWLLARFTFQFQ